MTSRARKAEKTEFNKLLKEINKRMSDFEDSVEQFKVLKESAEQLEETIAQQAAINSSKLSQLERDFNDNKLKAVTRAAQELGKLLINREEHEELERNYQKLKENTAQEIEKSRKEFQEKFDQKLESEIKLKELRFEAESAKLRADIESRESEVANLKDSLNRMADELKSQKELTASVVAPRGGGNKNGDH